MQQRADRRSRVHLVVGFMAALVVVLALPTDAAAASDPIVGVTDKCDNFRIDLLDFGLFDPDILGLDEIDITDEGWVWIDRNNRRLRSVTGRVRESHVARNDTPANHDSHDHNTVIVVDTGTEDILSSVNGDSSGKEFGDVGYRPDTIEVEWEIGTRPSEKTGDGASPTFPKWAWPSVGDRVWMDGNWIFDCGHATEVVTGQIEIGGVTFDVKESRYRAELHPARAVAAMRRQVHELPGAGMVPVTATDLYVHGRGGFVTDILNCGMGIIVNGVDGSGDPDTCGVKTTPIDTNFDFDVCLPLRPSPDAVPAWTVDAGPGNTIGVAPIISTATAAGGCVGPEFDGGEMLHVQIPLAGSGVSPLDVYARHIYGGWTGGPAPSLRHFRLTVNKMDLHDDTDGVPGDEGELTFFWLNVDKAAEEWHRLVDYEIPTDDDSGVLCPSNTNRMNSYDDDGLCGNGNLNFSGPVLDFYVQDGDTFSLRTNGYDQDCYDEHFGDHHLTVGMYVACHLDLDDFEFGNNDSLVGLPSELAPDATTFGPLSSPPYGVGHHDVPASKEVTFTLPGQPPVTIPVSNYELEFTIEEILDSTPPVTTAALDPLPNGAGWNRTAVSATLTAVDESGGSGVKELIYSVSGAQPIAPTLVAADHASILITNEGVSTLTFQARDNAGNLEVPQSVAIRVDMTPPTIAFGAPVPPPNANGWNNADVAIPFLAADALSGVAFTSPAVSPLTFTSEGLGLTQTVTAADIADNVTTAVSPAVNIDRTPPVVTCSVSPNMLTPPNHAMVPVSASVQVTDALSGAAGFTLVSVTSSETPLQPATGNSSPDIDGFTLGTADTAGFLRAERAGTGPGRIYTLLFRGMDQAGNSATCSAQVVVPHNTIP